MNPDVRVPSRDAGITLIADPVVAAIAVLEYAEPLVDVRGLLYVDEKRGDSGGMFPRGRA